MIRKGKEVEALCDEADSEKVTDDCSKEIKSIKNKFTPLLQSRSITSRVDINISGTL